MSPSGVEGAVLRDRRIVLARPAGQGDSLHRRLLALGAESLEFPGMEIVALPETAATRSALDRLGEADWAVFVSANAVRHGTEAVARRGGWPSRLRYAAVGAATARALEAAGCTPVLRPKGSEDSEGLLAAPGWGALAGQVVVIFRGEGGRETLAEGLRAAGAEVRMAELYRRLPPSQDPAPLQALLAAGAVSAIFALSGETIRNLFEACGAASRAHLCATPWLVPHARVAEVAQCLGATTVLISAGSADEAVLETLVQHFSVPSP